MHRTNIRSRPNIPQLHAQHLKLLPIITERLIPKRRTRSRDAVLEVVVQPEAVVAITITVSVRVWMPIQGAKL